jgi:hypothetical protein
MSSSNIVNKSFVESNVSFDMNKLYVLFCHDVDRPYPGFAVTELYKSFGTDVYQVNQMWP